ncbi:MAG: cytochrome c biogenesis protein CcdA [Chloroflexota bacterium]|nr:cytochrome c biogenesis protein CcdA [Chloroflexota bacterium]
MSETAAPAASSDPARTSQGARPIRSRSLALAVFASMGTLALTVAAALLTTDPTGGVNRAVEGASSASSTFFGGLSRFLPFGFAFGAGMASAVNPCGFAMLPAYLGLLVGGEAGAEPRPTAHRLATALIVAGTVTIGFVVLFGLVGLLIGLGAQVLVGVFPWIGLGVGVALVAVAGYRLYGGGVYSAAPEQLAARLHGTGDTSVRGYLLFGLSYGIASLSCTLPIFLAVVGGTVTAASLGPSVVQLALYGVGMGSVITALTLAVALFRSAMVRRLRAAVRFVDPIGTALLFVGGAYIVYYWLTIGGLLGRIG